MRVVERISSDYSPDVEIDVDGQVKLVRDIPEGRAVQVPAHMLKRCIFH